MKSIKPKGQRKTKEPIHRPPTKQSFIEIQRDYKQREFDSKAKELIWQLTEGGGSKNIHVLATIRELEFAYLSCAAYTMAARDKSI